MSEGQKRTLGQHLATRLSQTGLKRFFGVPGDFNLALLDEISKEPSLKPHWCTNELNSGYAADGAARIEGIGCCVVTFTVGGLSVINAIAGCFAENVPVVCITGSPNSNDYATNNVLHHTTGLQGDFEQELRCFEKVTCEQVVIRSLDTAHELIDRAISAVLHHSKPVYISIACNLAALSHASFAKPPIPFSLSPLVSNQDSLSAAVTAATQFLNSKSKPVLVAGPLLGRPSKATGAFMNLVDASGYACAFLPAAKGLLPEDHPSLMGTYWGQVSTPGVGEVVESSDAYVFVGSFLNDYSSVGNTLVLSDDKMVQVAPYRVTVAGGRDGAMFGCVRMDDFLQKLAENVKFNNHALSIYNRMKSSPPFSFMSKSNTTESNTGETNDGGDDDPLLTRTLYGHIQHHLITSDTILVAETGDAVFNCQKLKLPSGCQYHWSQQYGSIGWSVGATFGLACACSAQPNNKRRVVACIGDGSFQMTCQEVSSMMRYNANCIIILINNGSYTIESQIHEGTYNTLKNWNYTAFVEAIDNGQNKVFAAKVSTPHQLRIAVEQAVESEECRNKLCFIESMIHKDDVSKELLEWGSLVARYNARPPRPYY